jgi:Rrf2 family transcriptional regulator, iron-sulfur cluster assembly transcription factor
MLRPSKKTALAFEAVVDIAFHGGAEPVQSQDIARRLRLPRRYLEQVLQQLVRCGVLKGVRGPRGGYRLARERRRVTVGEVIRVLEGGEDTHSDVPAESGSPLGARVINPFWEKVSRELMERLDAVTIEDLCREAEGQAIESEGRSSFDFVI